MPGAGNPFGRQALEEAGQWRLHRPGDLPEPRGGNAVGSALVLLDLLEAHAAGIGQLVLGHSKFPAPAPDLLSQVNVDHSIRRPCSNRHVLALVMTPSPGGRPPNCVPKWDFRAKSRKRWARVRIAARMGAGLVLGVADSSRPSLLQDLAWRLEALAFDAVTLLARSFPIDAVSDFGATLVGWLGPLTSTNRVVETNIRIAFPDLDDAGVDRLVRAQWRALGRWAAEFPILDKIIADPGRVEVVNGERLVAIARGRSIDADSPRHVGPDGIATFGRRS